MKNEKSIRRSVRRSYTVSTVSIALVLYLLGTIGYALHSLYETSNEMRRQVTMIVEIDDNLSEEQRIALSDKIAESDIVASIKFVSKEEKFADQEFRKAFAVDIEGVLNGNPLPDSFDVTLSAAAADREALNAFIAECEKVEGVGHISYPEIFLSKMHSALDTVQIILLAFAGVMLIISLILLGNTIRLAVYSRRQTISTLKAVGATKWYIMKPFVGDSALQGLVAGVVAALLFAATLYGLDYAMPELHLLSRLEVPLITAGAMVVAGIVLAVIYTAAAVSKFVNMKSNKIHLY
ncbi:MAG: permease-like cell division protein FtsX [Alistipes sp.]|nr:permease-like cell division protein FtsX [Alistipes sp.]